MRCYIGDYLEIIVMRLFKEKHSGNTNDTHVFHNKTENITDTPKYDP